MRHATALPLDATMDHCLAALIDIGRAAALSPEARADRLARLADAALGAASAEVDDDPIAVRLRAIDATLAEHPAARDAWRARVRGAIVAASSGVVAFARAA